MSNHKLSLVIIALFLVWQVSAITYCSTGSIDAYWNRTETVNPVSFTCTNQIPNVSVIVNSVGNYFTTNPSSPITLQSNPQSIILNFQSDAPAGDYTGFVTFSDSSQTIPVNMHITQKVVPADPSTCAIDIFPTTLSNVKLTSGEKKYRNIQFSLPTCFTSYVKISGIDMQTNQKPIQLGELSLGNIYPGNSVLIPIELDAVDVMSGQYTDVLQLLVYDDQGKKISVPSVGISVLITNTLSPITNDTFSTKPTCSISATNLNLNSSYSFTCSNAVANLDIEPQYNEYFKGQKVDISSGIYRYDFIPTKYGITTFKAIFRYKSAPIFDAYEQEVRITSSGSITPGTDLAFYFTPKLENAKKGESVYIQLVDNKTGSLVNNPSVLVDAKPLNNTSESFEFKFESDKEYELRGKSSGYPDIVRTIKITPKDLEITINPTVGDATTNFNISVNTDNATLIVRGVSYSNNYYGQLSPGLNEIKATKEGYNTKSINITIDDYVRVIFGGEDFKRGVEQTIHLNKNVSWSIFYKPKIDTLDTERDILNVGTGNLITFIPKKRGVYQIAVEGNIISTYETKSFSFSNKWWFMPVWGWILTIGILIALIFFIIILRGPSNSSSGGGLTYQVGDGQ